MSTVVLVHGSWHWGGCFQKVANILAAAGHKVLCPDLATHGYDTTPVGTVRDIQQYTRPLREAVDACGEPVVLVGHSLGGVSCSYIAEELPEKVEKIIYLAGFMCAEGKSANDYIFSDAYSNDPAAAELYKLLSADPAGTRLALDNPALLKAAFYADCSDHDIAVARSNVVAITPAAPSAWAMRTTPGRSREIPRFFIECAKDKAIPLAVQRLMQEEAKRANATLSVLTLDSSHSPFFSSPTEVSGMIAKIVA